MTLIAERENSAAAARRAPQEASVAEAPGWLTRGRVPRLDGLRGIAILLVLLCHGAIAQGFPVPRLAPLCTRLGALGVDLFFAISGFLITLLLLRELERTQTVSLKGFYLRRALRILPAYAAFLIVLFTLSRLGIAPVDRRGWLGILTYTVNFRAHFLCTRWEGLHLWSLSAEEQFYLLWPPLLLLLRPKRARLAILGYLAAAPALRCLLWVRCPGVVPTLGMFKRVDSMAAGCLLALLALEPWFRRRTALSRRQAAGIGALAVGLLLIGGAMGQRPASLWT